MTFDDIKTYMHGPRGKFTLTSGKTGRHFTYSLGAPEDDPSRVFVRYLNGPDNESDYAYLCMLKWAEDGSGPFPILTRASRVMPGAPVWEALRYLCLTLQTQTELPALLEFRHEGTCCRCGRTLTTPESIDRGIGPVCATK